MIDMSNNRVPYGLLTDEEKAALRDHEKAGGKFECYYPAGFRWSRCIPEWCDESTYRTVPLPAQRSEQSSLKTQDVTGYEKGLNDALACIASLGYGRSYDVDHGHDEAFRAVAKYRDDWKAGATKKTQDVIAWDRLPAWVEWVARDEDGKVFCSADEQKCDASKWLYSRHILCRRIDDFPGIVQIGTADWRESKQRRPRG
jgi:hypothetical protein